MEHRSRLLSAIDIYPRLHGGAQSPDACFNDPNIIIELSQQNTEVEVCAVADRRRQSFAMSLEIEQSVELSGLNIGGDNRFDSATHLFRVPLAM